MSLQAGDRIYIIDDDREAIVEGIWPVGASKIVDFSVKYIDRSDTDSYGNSVCGTRGLSFKDEGIKWIKKT